MSEHDFLLPAPGALCVALDHMTPAQAELLVSLLRDHVGWFKVAATMFTRYGHEVVQVITRSGAGLFLDLKFHDIPSQVAGAVAAARALGAGLVTVHAAGGRAMVQAACAEKGPRMRVLAVTVLTALEGEEFERVWGEESTLSVVKRLTDIAIEAGADGVVVSAKEVGWLRTYVPKGFLLVVPGLRAPGQAAEDQARVGEPLKALRDGADILVLGRAVTKAEDPVKALKALFQATNGP